MLPWHKRLEGVSKRALARVLRWLLPRAPVGAVDPALESPRRVLLVRIDDRVGEAVLLSPLVATLRNRRAPPEVDVLVHARTARVVEGLPGVARLLTLDRRWLALGPLSPGIRTVRRAGPWDLVVDCGNWEVPAVTSAVVSRLVAGRAVVVGPAVAPTGPLHDVPVPRLSGSVSEIAQRLRLLEPVRGLTPVDRTAFRTPRPAPALTGLLETVRASPHAVLVPGGRLGWRRIPPALFAAAGRAARDHGRRVVVAWGPGEESLAREVADAVPGASVAPPTDLDGLAALLAATGCTVCNNSGPMHLSVAVGAPTLALFLRMDPRRWGYDVPPHRALDLTPTPDADRPPLLARAVREFLDALPVRPA